MMTAYLLGKTSSFIRDRDLVHYKILRQASCFVVTIVYQFGYGLASLKAETQLLSEY